MAKGVVVFFAILVCSSLIEVAFCHYTPTWAVHVPAGKETADAVALDHGFVNLGEVSFTIIAVLYPANR